MHEGDPFELNPALIDPGEPPEPLYKFILAIGGVILLAAAFDIGAILLIHALVH